METLKEAIQYVEKIKSSGNLGHCPCCNQPVKVYRRKLNARMTRALIEIYKASKNNEEYIHVGELLTSLKINAGNSEYSKLAYWKLLEIKPNTDPEKKDSGFWRLTDFGRSFVKNELSVFSHVFIYNTQRLAYDKGLKVNVIECLGKQFNYQKLMQNL